MTERHFPQLDRAAIAPTQQALHEYAKIIGSVAAANRAKRKHWWHISLRPSLRGLTTGVVYAATDVELELDFVGCQLTITTPDGKHAHALSGQAPADVAAWVDSTLGTHGIKSTLAGDERVTEGFNGFSADAAKQMQWVFASVSACMENLRAGIREETSPIQLWPHHFDLSMIWLPGNEIPGQDPADEEYSDKQMNFGFLFGDEGIKEPYFYITAYPVPDAMPSVTLPGDTAWQSEPFPGVVILYRDLVAMDDPAGHLAQTWNALYDAGREHLANDN